MAARELSYAAFLVDSHGDFSPAQRECAVASTCRRASVAYCEFVVEQALHIVSFASDFVETSNFF